jgi:CDP-diacylglycerol--serine O-phosphatidyltransferase
MIHLLPNIFTTLNIFCGFYAIISIIKQDLWRAGWAILFAIVFDIFDGRIARLLKASSSFGLEYDSLCDLISFGVAPSLLVYQFGLKELGKIGWLACFLYTTCVALRLARFNVKTSSGYAYFEGLPSPAGAAILASGILFLLSTNLTFPHINQVLLIVLCFIAYLLVSSIEYPSFKEIKIKKTQTFYFLIFFVLGLTIASLHPPLSLLVIISIYTLLGPLLCFKNNRSKVFRRLGRKNKNF